MWYMYTVKILYFGVGVMHTEYEATADGSQDPSAIVCHAMYDCLPSSNTSQHTR